jgi:hypothetical protein
MSWNDIDNVMLKVYDLRVWIGFGWMKVGSMACFFEHGYEPSGDTKGGGFLDRLSMLGCLTRKDDAVRMYLISCEVIEHVAVLFYQYLKNAELHQCAGGQLPTAHHGGAGSLSGQSVLGLW